MSESAIEPSKQTYEYRLGYIEGYNKAYDEFREQLMLACNSRPIQYIVPVTTITDDWGNSRTIVHEMGQ